MNWDEEHIAKASLTWICEPGDGRLNDLVASEGAQQVITALKRQRKENSWSIRANALNSDELISTAEQFDLRFIISGDDQWPSQLDDLNESDAVGDMVGAPFGLWLKGEADLPQLLTKSIAIVGARAATNYGATNASQIAAELAEHGYTVISGGALGIDSAAHRGALASGASIGVYASGLDECYPKTNSSLFQQMAQNYLVVSEVPPGIHPTRRGFLARNRLIAALAGAVFVVESAARSGALNTVSWAETLSKQVFALPGSVNSPVSVGNHRLIRDQRAQLVTDSKDILGFLSKIGESPDLPITGEARVLDELPRNLMVVREALPGRGRRDVNEISVLAGYSVAQTITALSELELLGYAQTDDSGLWRLTMPKTALPQYL